MHRFRGSSAFPLALTPTTWLNPLCSVLIRRPPTLRVPQVRFLGSYEETREIIRLQRSTPGFGQKTRRQGRQTSAWKIRVANPSGQNRSRTRASHPTASRSRQKSRGDKKSDCTQESRCPEKGGREKGRPKEGLIGCLRAPCAHPSSSSRPQLRDETGHPGPPRADAPAAFNASASFHTPTSRAGFQPESHHGRLQEEKERHLPPEVR